MKPILRLLFIILMPIGLLSQSEVWPVKAVPNEGEAIPIKAFLKDGTTIPVNAIFEAGSDHFMDVKAIHKGEIISIKLIASNDMLVPVKGITKNGEILNVKGVTADGKILDVKGVSRDGNVLNIAAIKGGKNIPLKAISPEGVTRSVLGLKFSEENVEMEIGDVKVIGHVKALPTLEVGEVDRTWEVAAMSDNNERMGLVAISKKGKEIPVRAEMEGKHPYLMHVRAETNFIIHIKLVKNSDGIVLTGIDEFGRPYEVVAKSNNGDTYKVFGGKTVGNITSVYALGPGGKKFPIKAISSKGHEFDVKGLKIKKDEVEGTIGVVGAEFEFFAHVTAIAPAQVNQ